MIKAVLFDYGGVLTEGGKAGCMRRLFASAYGITEEAVNGDDLFKEAALGRLNDQEFLAAMNQRHPDLTPMDHQAYVANSDIFVRAEPVYQLAADLRAAGIITGMLSNINQGAADELRARGFYEGFDPLVLSYQVGVIKPDPQIYRIAIEQTGVLASEILFVDDQDHWRQPAEALGMHFLLATSPAQIVTDTKALLKLQA